MAGVPAFVQNGRLDVLAANPLARALYADLFDDAGSGRPPNHALFTFLDPRAADPYPEWQRAAAGSVALLRAEAGRSPDDRALTELVGRLTTRSERFSACGPPTTSAGTRPAPSTSTTRDLSCPPTPARR